MSILNFLFEVTPRCNNNCSFCYNVWKNNPAYPRGELNLTEIKSLFDGLLPGLPTSAITLGGGEPLLREDLEDIVKYFADKKFFVSVSTNGSLLTEERAKNLIKAGVGRFEITLLSAGKKIHDELCRNPGCYDKACEAITNSRKFKARTALAFVATRHNVNGVSEVADLGFALGIDMLAFYRFIPTGAGLLNERELTPDIEELNKALEILDNKSKEYNLKVIMGIPIEPCKLKTKLKNIKTTFCQAGLTKFTIDYSGNLRLCEQSPEIIGSLFKNRFVSLALGKKVKDFRNFSKPSCAPCKYKRICKGGCRFLSA